MKIRISLGTAIMFMIMSGLTAFVITYMWGQNTFNNMLQNYYDLDTEYARLSEVEEVISKYYVGEYSTEEAMDVALAGYVIGVGDQWSHYLTKEEYEQYLIDSSGQLVGVGISVFFDTTENAIFVQDVYENSPAEDEGMVIGDYIIAVDDVLVSEIGYTESVNSVRGEVGTDVKITVARQDGTEEDLVIERQKIEKISIKYELLEQDIGYIEIADFDQNVDEQFADAVDDLLEQGATSFIFDVRNNPGGNVETMSNMIDMLVPEGIIISLRDKTGEGIEYTSDAQFLDMPIAVIVNESSISAAEFFAAALAEYEVATIVGAKTGGKGYSQQPIELSDGSALILSTNEYFTPQDKNLAGTGVTPDVEIELSEEDLMNFYKLEPYEDEQIIAAMGEVTK